MKKITFISILIAVATIITVISCIDRQAENKEIKNEVEAITLLRQYNETMLNIDTATRGGGKFWKWLKEALILASYDLGGAAAGIGTVGGIAILAGLPTAGVGTAITAASSPFYWIEKLEETQSKI